VLLAPRDCDTPGRPLDPDAKNLLRKAGSYSYIGIFLGVAILIGFLGGSWLDKRFGTQPWLTLVGLLVGIASGARELYRLVKRGMKDEA
jgi:ATP synthase protein I